MLKAARGLLLGLLAQSHEPLACHSEQQGGTHSILPGRGSRVTGGATPSDVILRDRILLVLQKKKKEL